MLVNAVTVHPQSQPTIVGPGPDVPTQPTPDPAPSVGDSPISGSPIDSGGSGPMDKLSGVVLGKIAGAQQKAVESQQLLGAVSQMVTMNVGQLAKSAWTALRAQ